MSLQVLQCIVGHNATKLDSLSPFLSAAVVPADWLLIKGPSVHLCK